MVNAVGYCRFSSDQQREESIDAQKRAIKYYASQNGYNIVRFYEDRAMSGKSSQRPDFLQMIEDVKKDDIQAVIVHKLDRFSRNAADSINYEHVLKDHDVKLVSVMENLDNSPAGNLMRLVISAINSYYVDNLSTEVLKGMKENAHQCLATGGTPPLGYDIKDKRYIINEHEAEAIRIIFTMYDEGYGYISIINQLNVLGYTTKRGQSFGKNSIYELLRNERYKGTYVFNKMRTRRSDGSRGRKYKPDNEIIRIPGGVPAIVPEEMWQRANDRLDENKRKAGQFCAKETYLLSGLIYCGECGYAMHGNSRRPAPDRDKYIGYRCNHKDNNNACSSKEIKRDDVEEFVLTQLEEKLFNDDVIPQITQDLNDYILASAKEYHQRKAQYEAKQKELQQSKKNILDAIAKSGFEDVFKSKLTEIETDLANVAISLKSLQSEHSITPITEAMVREHLKVFRQFIRERNIPQIKRCIDAYVERVDVYTDTVKVTLRVAFSFCPLEDGGYRIVISRSREAIKAALR